MRILVSAASKHGSTAEIATRIAAALRADLPIDDIVEVRSAADVDDVTSYDAVVLGSAVYMGRWTEHARELAALVAAEAPRPVWLFSSGPVGVPPKPTEEPVDVIDIANATRSRGHRLFAGRIDRHVLGFAERAVVLALRVPDGDFRDWEEIDAWAKRIAADLTPAPVT